MTAPLDLDAIRARLEVLEKERDDSSADAETQIAGMREVALFRAANAQGCIGSLARPLLNECDRLAQRVSDLEGALRQVVAMTANPAFSVDGATDRFADIDRLASAALAGFAGEAG